MTKVVTSLHESDSIEFASIAEIGRMYRTCEIDPIAVTQSAISRIREYDSNIKAFITVDDERALSEARFAAQELGGAVDRGPLHGVPVAIKDNIDTLDMRTTGGSGVWSDRVPDSDAELVKNLREAGAIVIGKTNMQEFAHGVPHPDFGQTRNPWDPARTAGGSSGGSAAAVAAGFCFAAVGTDTGGSVRVPASYCGVAGLKPTYGLVSTQGVFPLSWSLDHAGPLARSSGDAALLLEGMTGGVFRSMDKVDIGALRVGLISPHAEGPELEQDVQNSFLETIELLRQHGAAVEPVEIRNLEIGEVALSGIVGPEASVAHSQMLLDRPGGYAAQTRSQLEVGFGTPATLYVRLQQFRRQLATEFLTAMRGLDILVSPTVAWSAPAEDPSILSEQGLHEGRRTVPYNLIGFPALSLRSGFDREGLPIGFQIAARPMQDALVLGVGAALESLIR